MVIIIIIIVLGASSSCSLTNCDFILEKALSIFTAFFRARPFEVNQRSFISAARRFGDYNVHQRRVVPVFTHLDKRIRFHITCSGSLVREYHYNDAESEENESNY
jgi:hypothetical protein